MTLMQSIKHRISFPKKYSNFALSMHVYQSDSLAHKLKGPIEETLFQINLIIFILGAPECTVTTYNAFYIN